MDPVEISPDELILAYGEVNIQLRMKQKELLQAHLQIVEIEKKLEFYDDKLWNESAPENNLA